MAASLVGPFPAAYTGLGLSSGSTTGMRTAPASPPASPGALRACGVALARLLLLAGLAAAPAWAARVDFYFQRLQAEPGLAQNTVNALLQDQHGFVWIATQGGLHRYDGYRHELFQHHADRPDGIPDSFVTALANGPDRDMLFVGTNAHYVAALDLASGRFRRYGERAPQDVGGRAERVRALLFQPGEGLWVGTGAGIDLLDPHSGQRRAVLRFGQEQGSAAEILALAPADGGGVWAASNVALYRASPAGDVQAVEGVGAVRALARGRDGSLWLGGNEGLLRIAPGSAALEPVWSSASPGSPPAAVVAIAEDQRGMLWLALEASGIARLDPATGEVVRIQHDPQLPASLPEQSIVQLMVDRSGLLWLGGQVRGVVVTRTEGAPFVHVLDLDPARDRISTNHLRALHQAPDGGLWLGTEGDGLKRYDLEADRFDSWSQVLARAMGQDRPPREFRVLGIAPGDAETLWISTNHGLFHLDPAARSARRIEIDPKAAGVSTGAYLRALLRARDGSLWIGTYGGGLVHFHPGSPDWHAYRQVAGDPASLSHDLINCVFEDAQGRIWIGTLDGLNVLDPSSGQLRRFRHDPTDPRSLSGNLVRVVRATADGTLWVGTHSGLNRVIESEDGAIAFERIGVEQGLPNPAVYGVLEDALGRLWISSNGGIARYDRTSGEFRRFGVRDGLQDLEFNGGAWLELADGRLAFGGTRGLNLFWPEAILDSAFAPPVVLTSLRAGADPADLAGLVGGREVRVGQDARVLRIGFAALDYAAPERNRFRYRLEGFDPGWVEAGSPPEAAYTNLDPGRYTFRAQGSNRDGVWSSNELVLPITVVPPWWNSLPAHLAYAMALAAAVMLLVMAQRSRRSQQRALLAQIREREERLKLALWGSGDEFWDWNVRENSLFRLGADQLLGLRREHQVSTDDWRSRAVHPEDLPRVQRILQEHIVGHTEFFESEHRIRNAQGGWVWVRSRGKVVARDEAGNPLRISGTARDISASRRAERDRRIATEVLRSMGEAVAVADLEFRFVSVNPAFSRMTGYGEEEVRGQATSLLDSPQHSAEYYQRVRESLEHTGHWQGEMWQRRKDGEEFLGWIELSEVRDGHGTRTHYVAVVGDITDKKRAEQELRYLANYDTLTGLPNRTLLAERLARAVVRARRQDTRVAVLFLDLDRFKDVNDSMGHAAGDRILKAAAARLLTTVRETDTVARLGGDEFTVVLEDMAGLEVAEEVARKIIAAFAEPLDLDGRGDVVVSPSIGISLYPDHGLVPTDLLKFADTAMYQAKDRGRNTYQVYTEAMDAEAKRRANMIAALRKGLDRGEFRLVFQPRLSLLDERITGVEALVRWHSEDLGEVLPTVFIPLAEETGLILPIGEWVLREACLTLKRWRHQGLTELCMAVNVSVLQLLRGDLPTVVREVLAEVGVPAERIELEVTESMVMANAQETTAVLRDLKQLGVTLAIDDFGTGYSSLVYLKRLPIDTLKIDKEFIGDITTDPDDEAITATVITMAHSLGLNVVAEGVESGEQLAYLREQGCDEIQGFWLAPPLEPHHCVAFIRGYAPGREQGRIAAGAVG